LYAIISTIHSIGNGDMGRIKSLKTTILAEGILQAFQAAIFIASHCRMK